MTRVVRAIPRPLLGALIVVLTTLPAMWPFLMSEGYWVSHDGHFHLYRLLSLESAWRQGIWYPRLFPEFAFGYGFAVLNFYGPLSYYVALALSTLFAPVVAMKLTYAISYPLAALSAWWFARDLWQREDGTANELAGLAAATAYTYVPYHLADVQLRGALAESWAFVWMPLLFWASWRLRLRTLMLALAALVLTHNLSVVLIAFPLLIWTALSLQRAPSIGVPRVVALRNLVLSGVGALLLSTFYWLPVLLESRFVWIAQDVGGEGFATHLAAWREWIAVQASYRYYPEQGVGGEHPLSWAQVALFMLAALSLPSLWRTKRRILILFWWIVLVFSLFLVTTSSLAVWRAFVFPFGLIQYPWRWLGVTALATSMLAGSIFIAPTKIFTNGLRSRSPSVADASQVVALALTPLILGWLAFTSLQYLPWEPRLIDPARHPVQMWEEDAAEGQVGATWTAEFLPLTVREQRWALARAPETVVDVGERTSLRVARAGGDGFTLWADVEASEPGWLTFPRFAYPSMRVTVDGEVYPLEARGVMGLAAVEVPEGAHRVTLAAYPLADKLWLRALLWIVPLGVLLLTLSKVNRKWLLAAAVGLPLLVVTGRVVAGPIADDVTVIAEVEEPHTLSKRVQLVGLRNDGVHRTGNIMSLTLFWFNLEQTDQAYVSYVHLTTPDGETVVAQHDSEPNMGTVPTPRWLPGQLVEDLHLLTLPSDLPSGEYELWGGMYTVKEGAAVPLPEDSGERRFLGIVRVGE